jgi:hypothetical protein
VNKTKQTDLVVSEKMNGQILSSVDSLFAEYDEKLSGIKRISDFAQGKDELIQYFTREEDISDYRVKDLFNYTRAKAGLDAEFWEKAINMTDVLQCMSANKRNKWRKDIYDKTTPSFERDTVIETLRNLLLSRGTFLAEKVDGIFRKLSGKHLTNSPLGFKKRMIVTNVVSSYGMINHETSEFLHDLRSVISTMLGRDDPKSYNTHSDLRVILQAEAFGKWFEFDGGAFKVKLFKSATTAHLEVHPEIAVKLNLILASLYPHAIASGSRTVTRKEKSIPLHYDILNYEVTNNLSRMADKFSRVRDGSRSAYIDKEGMSQSVRDEVEKVLKFLGGKLSHKSMWAFDYDASGVLMEIVRTGRLPEKKSHGYYPTEKELALRVVELANISDEDIILEPSAGQGGIVNFLPKDQTTCIEVSSINSLVLKKKGFTVINADFLRWESKTRFSKIVMNPPFAKGAAEMHVAKAAELLSQGGKLIAILPASLRNKTLVQGMNHVWSEVIEQAFESTGVNVVILELERE